MKEAAAVKEFEQERDEEELTKDNDEIHSKTETAM